MFTKTVSSVIVLVAIILIAVFLKHLKLIRSEHAPVFSKLVTTLTLPALIFHSLAHATLYWEYVLLALVMVGAEVLSLILAWLIGKRLRLESPQLGSFMLVSGFGSSALLGYALIGQIFPGNTAAITEAVLITEVGVGPALFTIGTMIAMYYGSNGADTRARIMAALGFFKSPICCAVVAGIAWTSLDLPVRGMILDPVFQSLQILSSANTLMVALTVGVVLQFSEMRAVMTMAFFACLLKLVLKPVMVWLPTLAMDLHTWQVEILVLEAAMPSALLTVVLANTYGCDARLASKLVFATTMAGIATIIVMFRLLV
jgi:predicted permease